ncbi:hypothetical protein [Paenibacillus silvisoli]|uniref:hypothetical protein n=1 Tax=Paenibacillus silvisoli TaxID=3110539 RepID=UPI0028040349|nr:hypothetical protein [Paenibacillus silvisoli]
MKYAKQYGILALLLVSVLALNLWMDVLLRLSAYRIVRNLTFPFIMLDPIEKVILAVVIFLVVRRPLGALLGKLMPHNSESQQSGKSGGGGSGGAQPAPEQADQQ